MTQVGIIVAVLVLASISWLSWEIRNAKPDPRDP